MKPLTAALIAVQQNADLLKGEKGDPGKDGDPGVEGKAAVDGLTWRGTFAYGTTYQPGDVVEWEGSSYVALVVTARRPPDPDWDLLAAKGEAGASGRGYIRGGGGSGSGSALAVKDEGVSLTAAAASIDFAGAGVTATAVGTAVTVTIPAGGVSDADYLVGTAHAGLSAEIVVGATPGGELGGTWASPTVDAVHSGSSHASLANVYIQDADPGAVGTGKLWLNTTGSQVKLLGRNNADDGWVQVFKYTSADAIIIGQNDGSEPNISFNSDGSMEWAVGAAGLFLGIDSDFGDSGDVLTAQGDGTALWVPPAASGLTQPQVMARMLGA